MTFTSYAQNFEDVMLWRALQHIPNGCYIDVGAQHPVVDSVSKAFYDRGWRGIHVEPVPEYANLLRQQRPDESVLQVALGSADGTLTLNIIAGTGLSTAVERHATSHLGTHGFSAQKTIVPVLTLKSAFRHLQGRDVHWLKIDVEGFEHDVLKGWDSSVLRPWIMIIEATEPLSRTLDHHAWEQLVLDGGYTFAYFDGLNRFYVANEHSSLLASFSTPPNIFDYVRLSGENSSEWSRGIVEKYEEKLKIKNDALIQALDENEKTRQELQLTIDRLENVEDSAWQTLSEFSVQAADGRRVFDQELENTQRQLKEARDHGEALNAQLNALHAQIDASSAQIDASNAQLNASNAQLQAQLGSLSWRITRPFRSLYTVLPAGVRRQARRGLKALYWAVTPWKLPARRRFIRERNQRAMPPARPTPVLKAPPTPSALDSYEAGPQHTGATADPDVFATPLGVGKRTIYLFVDHTISCATNTGVQRVVRGLAAGLAQTDERVRFVKWDPGSKQCILISREDREYLSHWNGPAVTKLDLELYQPAAIAAVPVPFHRPGANNWLVVPEVTHLTPHSAPVTLDLIGWARRAGLASGFVFYDAIPLRRPELRDTVPRHREYMQHLRLADVVWPISEWAREDLLAYWSKSELATSSTIPEVTTFSLPGESTLRQRVTLPADGDTLIISVGSIEPRKNQVALVRAFQAHRTEQPNSPWRLVLVGNLHPLVAAEINAAVECDPAISYRGHVTDEELDDLYGRCSFSVFPSIEEGFGLPILESLWYGKPCLCANFGAMAEVARDGGCLTIDVRDANAFQDALTRLISDVDLRASLSASATKRPIATWNDYTEVIRSRINREVDVHESLGTIYYWVDSTIGFPKNTGIQRVGRQLARGLLNLGFRLTPIRWDKITGVFSEISYDEKKYLSQWSGPAPEQWTALKTPAPHNSWFLMPELPLNLSTTEQRQFLSFAKSLNLRSAAIFYDAIPWKLRRDYPESFATAHHEYMSTLAEYDLVLPISEFSRGDLIHFLGSTLDRPRSLDSYIKTVSLPGEFIERPRATTFAPRASDVPITILCVGTVEPRKNHLILIHAFLSAQARTKRELRLIIAGRDCVAELTDSVNGLVNANPNISWEMNADDERLQELYELCDLTAYPSIEEGFGLPILESLWCGKPCICANFGAMYEVANQGGCLTIDVRDSDALADAILTLSENKALDTLTQEATNLEFKSWSDYALEVSLHIAKASPRQAGNDFPVSKIEIERRVAKMNLGRRPRLSICISTYNRSEWLARSLVNWSSQCPEPFPGVELLVCDNASTDNTSEVIKPYLQRADFSYHCNSVNVGMLGNLRETAHHARGEYVWIIGDDDLLLPGSIARVMNALDSNNEAALIYLNYSFTRIEDARTITDFGAFFDAATPIVPSEPDISGPIRTICARNENFFTAIYTLVLRRDHAINAYSQDTSGRPFSSMKTAIPTTHYVLSHMMDEPGVWIGAPQIVVNMNVSWMRYAPLWILERVPEFYDLAEKNGADPLEVDRWRSHTIGSIEHFFRQIYQDDPLDNASFFQVERLVWRFKHLQEFKEIQPRLLAIYETAHAQGHHAAKLAPSSVFPQITVTH
ncbi:FkbM family methyltransferase [Variovorax sp. GT1P44]|uniref:FkbM family methyltransferase n=1 Tax=Variovorax sp. GT1P44 TaxID=3443742 RepID=UPI003F46B7D8